MDKNAEVDQTPSPKDAAGTSLFMSYAHKDDAIRERISQYLISKGYDCRYDWEGQRGIDAGDNWRKRIGEMIKDANGNVIALLSGESMKPDGVCRNELAIALNVRNGRVQPVLIAPESEVDIPPSIVHIQWLDMSKWDEKAKNILDFEEWFEEQMDELHKALQNPAFFSFNEEITKINEALEVRQNLSKVYSMLAKDFYGREWLTEEMDAWAKDRDSAQMKVLIGDPGFGKSAWAAHFAHHARTVDYRMAIGTFCERDTDRQIDPKVVVQTIAFALACCDEAYRADLVEVVSDPRNLEGNAGDLFDVLLADPLKGAIDGGHENVIVILDGLDEAGPANGGANPLAQLLAERIGRLPRWVKFLVTTRDVPPVTDELNKADHDNLLDRKNLNEDINRWDDVEGYVRQQLQEKFGSDPAFEETVQMLKEKSNGDFFYASLVIDALNDSDNAMGLAAVQDLAPGLAGAILSWFQWIFGNDEDSLDEYDEEYADALGFIHAAPNALPTDELPTLLPDWRDRKIKRFLRKIRILTRIGKDELSNETVTFNHDFVKTWLADKDAAGDYYVGSKDALTLMGKLFYEKATEDREALTPYETIYTLGILETAGLTKEYETLRNDVEFIGLAVDMVRDADSPLASLPTVAKIGIAQRFAQHISLPGSLGDEAARELVKQRARLLKELAHFCHKLLRVDDMICSQKEVISLWGRLMETRPSVETIKRYESAIYAYARMLQDESSALPEDYEKAKGAYLEGADTLENIVADAPGTDYSQEAIQSIYGALFRLARRNHCLEDAMTFASKHVLLVEALIRDHTFKVDDPFSSGGLYRPYQELAEVQVDIDQGRIDQALVVLRKGLSFLEEHLSFEEADVDRKRWFPDRLRFKNLNGIYCAMRNIALRVDDVRLMRALFDEQLDFINGIIWSFDLSPSEKANEIARVTEDYLRGVPDETEEGKLALIERVRPWFMMLEAETNCSTYQGRPRERFAGLLAGAGMFEDAIEEYSHTLDHVRRAESDVEEDSDRMWSILNLYYRMALAAEKNESVEEAIEYGRRALDAAKRYFVNTAENFEYGKMQNDIIYASTPLDRAYDLLCAGDRSAYRFYTALLCNTGNYELVHPVVKEWISFIEEQSRRGKSVQASLGDAYSILSACFEKSKAIDEAIEASQRSAVIWAAMADRRESAFYLSCFDNDERLYRKAGCWDRLLTLSTERLSLAEAASCDDLLRYVEMILEYTVSCTECLLRLNGEEAARAFLSERHSNAPHVYSNALESSRGRRAIKYEMERIDNRIRSGKFGDSETGCKLIELISEWSGVEVPEQDKKKS